MISLCNVFWLHNEINISLCNQNYKRKKWNHDSILITKKGKKINLSNMSTENKEKKERKDGEGVYEEGEENEKKKRREKGSLIIDLC